MFSFFAQADAVITLPGTSNSVVITTIICAALAQVLFSLAVWIKAKAAVLSADQSKENSAKAVVNTEQSKAEIGILKDRIDGQMTALVKATEKASFAAGAAEQSATTATIDAAKAQGVAEHVAAALPENGHKVAALIKEVADLRKSLDELKQKP